MTERLIVFRANRKRYVYRVKGKGRVEVVAGPQSAYAHFGVDDGRTVYVHLPRPGKLDVRPESCAVELVSSTVIEP